MPPGAALVGALWPWIEAGRFHVDIALRFDALAAVMTLVVSGVGALIHVYSVGYMADDGDYARFFTYMNLFVLAMLVLVLADNLLLMFIGWEGVGLCSYLLIAFWYDQANSPTTAARPLSSTGSATPALSSESSRDRGARPTASGR